jgi:Pyruvate/2-oxoacid:ferredoxin oxidoreductase gamma subunit
MDQRCAAAAPHCHVCLSNERVGSPMVDRPDVLIGMNEPSPHKFASQVSPRATILYNNSKLPDRFATQHAPILCIPAAEIADSLGTTKLTNMVMLGALLELTHTLSKETGMTVLKAKIRNPKL